MFPSTPPESGTAFRRLANVFHRHFPARTDAMSNRPRPIAVGAQDARISMYRRGHRQRRIIDPVSCTAHTSSRGAPPGGDLPRLIRWMPPMTPACRTPGGCLGDQYSSLRVLFRRKLSRYCSPRAWYRGRPCREMRAQRFRAGLVSGRRSADNEEALQFMAVLSN